MNASDIATTHWALLIGINFYVRGQQLQGCVRDVEHAKQYLEARSTCTEVVTLTASAPVDPKSGRPAERPESWPTYENLSSSLARITAEAEPGNFIYIHYSGHGAPLGKPSSITNAPDVGFVLFDEQKGQRYFPGRVLSTALQKMVAKGLFVTLVLDCCFSGRTMRQDDWVDAAVRTVAYDPAIDAAYPQDVSASPYDQDTHSSSRGARVLPTWLVDPRGYTILTACGPTETARELTMADQWNGALSFFLFRTLDNLAQVDEVLTHENLCYHLCGQFRTFCPAQNPMRYGDGKLTFFGVSRPELGLAFIPVFAGQGSQLCLRAGRAHGVHEGDEYIASCLKPGRGVVTGANPAAVEVRVDAVHGLSSNLSVIDPAQAMHDIQAGWNAIPLTYRSPRNFHVRLDQVDDDSQWIEAMGKRRYLQLWTENEGGRIHDCIVTRNECNEYEILDDSRIPISSLPKTPVCQEGAMSHVLGLLEHIATFRTVKEIQNRDPTTSFDGDGYKIRSWGPTTVTIGDTHEAGHEDKDTYEVGHKDEMTIEVKNTSSSPLYLFIFSLGPSWQIESLISEDGGGDYMVMLPGATDVKCLEMTVPQSYIDRGEYECEDTVKIFITNQPTSFGTFQLHEIPVSIPGPAPGRSRGGCGVPSRPAPIALSESGIQSVFREKWDVRDIVIRTRYREGMPTGRDMAP